MRPGGGRSARGPGASAGAAVSPRPPRAGIQGARGRAGGALCGPSPRGAGSGRWGRGGRAPRGTRSRRPARPRSSSSCCAGTCRTAEISAALRGRWRGWAGEGGASKVSHPPLATLIFLLHLGPGASSTVQAGCFKKKLLFKVSLKEISFIPEVRGASSQYTSCYGKCSTPARVLQGVSCSPPEESKLRSDCLLKVGLVKTIGRMPLKSPCLCPFLENSVQS